jgi:hypothetical protein
MAANENPDYASADYASPDYSSKGGSYFAFVESIDALDGAAWRDRDSLQDHWRAILEARKELPSGLPTHRIWLDCVRRDYFLSLPWRDEKCERNDVDDANRRRQRLLEMDADQFAAVLLLIHRDDEDGATDLLVEGSWHRIVLSPSRGLPVVAAPDFDLEAAQLYYLQWHGDVLQIERDELLKVFNLEFVPDADWGERGGPSWRPYTRPPSKEAEFIHPFDQPLSR